MVFIAATALFAGISVLPAISDDAVPDYGIWLQQNSGNQQWAYYPYNGNLNDRSNYSAVNAGTDFFTVTPGTSIYRKIIVQNKLSYNTSVELSITGLPASWADLPPATPTILSGYYYDNGTWKSRPVGLGSKLSPQGFSRLIVNVPSGAQPGRYPYTLKASTYNATTGKRYETTLADAIVVGEGGGSVTPPDDPPEAPDDTPAETPASTTVHEGFENGYDKTAWVGSRVTNYHNDKVAVDTVLGHDGTSSVYGLVGGLPGQSPYARAARNVSYGGNGFELTAWFYVDANEPGMLDGYSQTIKGTSIWAGVLDIPAVRELIDETSHYRVVGYNNRTADHVIGYHIGAHNYKPLGTVTTSGWYRGVVTYDGIYMTFAQYDSAGNLIGKAMNYEPGFTPRAIIMNAGSRSHRIDDITYTTW